MIGTVENNTAPPQGKGAAVGEMVANRFCLARAKRGEVEKPAQRSKMIAGFLSEKADTCTHGTARTLLAPPLSIYAMITT